MSLVRMVFALWAMVALGTLGFLLALSARALFRCGRSACQSPGLGFSRLVIGLVVLSACWPWSLGPLMDKLREKG